ncbi:mediator complex, subunit Med20 [Aspergillus taichungensis]|uniref:Mediator of RNA polymerase II transcription subunit 20 n=1 Tax=Aspergillus taichungensis TaxID=482145 RepID=A0A2J5HUN0_9EURO|nr:mediator complex, subunit Med20 [Aspergillus taichungensis]
MSTTGVFFIPSNPNASTALATITERLHTALADNPIPIGRWALEHKLMRDTPSCLPASASQHRPQHPRYLQFLSLSYSPHHGFIYTSQPDATTQTGKANTPTPTPTPHPQPTPQQNPHHHHPADPTKGATLPVMTTLPLPSTSTLFSHFVYACQPFWCHRHTVAVPGGTVYDVGDFRVRIGDVRQTQPTARVRGTVVEIEWRGPSIVSTIVARTSPTASSREGNDAGDGLVTAEDIQDGDVEAEYRACAALIREFWAKLGVEGAREAILVPGVGTEVVGRLQRWRKGLVAVSGVNEEDPDPDAGVDVARQFMEIFRFNR